MSYSDGRRLATLGALISVVQLTQVAMSTTNYAVMGTLGVRHIAAGGLVLLLFNQIRSICVGVITGTENLVAIAVSSAEKRKVAPDSDVRAVLRSSFAIATVSGVLGGLLLIGFGWSLQWLGQDAAVLDAARPMIVALAPALLPYLWFQVLRLYTIGMQRAQVASMVSLGAALLNLVLVPCLVYGVGPLPALRLTGIGAATSLVFLLTAGVFWLLVRRDPALNVALSVRIWPVRWPDVRGQLRLGAPIALTFGSEAGIFSVLGLVIGTFGAATLAAHNVVSQVVYVVLQAAVGLSHGASILLSRAVFGGAYRQAHALTWLAVRQAAVIPALAGLLYLLAPDVVLRWFLDGAESAATLQIASTFLCVAVVLQFFDAAQTLGVGLLRGLTKTGVGFRASLLGNWVVGLPVALLLTFPLGLGAIGVWLGLTAGLATAAILMVHGTLARLRGYLDADRMPQRVALRVSETR
ncbi:MATE family efflux transporter [Nocardia altamirensis]|uniref:MATE family efflux transporter n=1 Tax=Nocardia altamirensis TaxID=472158 RepID=UPI0008408DD6|nr:MATE family efflux transporter [Nocardia altamirensis]